MKSVTNKGVPIAKKTISPTSKTNPIAIAACKSIIGAFEVIKRQNPYQTNLP
jgi:hypothetical protein